jgi:hypothetical protein
MDYRCIHPLYEQSDHDAAVDYLSNRLVRQTVITDEGDSIITSYYESLTDNIVRDMIEKMYGVNAVTIANMYKVQDTFMEKYKEHMIRYCDDLGVHAYTRELSPSVLVPYIMSVKLNNGTLKKPCYWSDPSKKWIMAYSRDPYENLMNPLNAFKQVELVMKLSNKNMDYVNYTLKHYTSTNEKAIRKLIDHGGMASFSYHILPCAYYDPIFNLLNAIHRYL